MNTRIDSQLQISAQGLPALATPPRQFEHVLKVFLLEQVHRALAAWGENIRDVNKRLRTDDTKRAVQAAADLKEYRVVSDKAVERRSAVHAVASFHNDLHRAAHLHI